VEFTAPVTKAQSKEQFRLRAGWETPVFPPEGRVKGRDADLHSSRRLLVGLGAVAAVVIGGYLFLVKLSPAAAT
jgi:hypothetical protein